MRKQWQHNIFQVSLTYATKDRADRSETVKGVEQQKFLNITIIYIQLNTLWSKHKHAYKRKKLTREKLKHLYLKTSIYTDHQ